LALAAPVGAAETDLLGPQTPWRVFLRLGPYVGRKDGTLVHSQENRPVDLAKAEFLKGWMAAHTPSPADGWFGADFDDSGWGRYQSDELADKTGGTRYGGGYEFAPRQTYRADRLHLRTCFGISDPAAAQDLSLELAYLGGAVVYLNGKEVGRGHLPAGGLDAAAFAADYPVEAYFAEDGTTFLGAFQPNLKDRFEQRIRRLKLRLPPESLI
jgi:hypothetical protein